MAGLFSMKGRLNRAKYLLYVVVIYAITIGIYVAVIAGSVGAALATVDPNAPNELTAGGAAGMGIGMIIAFLVMAVGAVVAAFQTVKRFHDLGKPGWWYWLLVFIPFFNIYLLIILLFQKGTTGDNTYGGDPLAGKA